MKGRRQCALGRPSSAQALFQRIGLEPENARPTGDAMGLAAECDEPVGSRVVGLGQRWRPSAIAGLVVPVIVDSVYGMPDRARTHVAQEGGEVCTPFRAHGDAARAVVSVGTLAGVVATRLRGGPGAVFARLAEAMLEPPGPSGFGKKASATPDGSAPEVWANDGLFLAALAPAQPCREATESRFVRRATDHRQAPECHPGQVLQHAASLSTARDTGGH